MEYRPGWNWKKGVIGMSGVVSGVDLTANLKENPALKNGQQINGVQNPENFQNVLGQRMTGSSVNMDAIFEEAAAKYDISPKLLRAVAKAESNFNPKARSGAGAMGVMQLMPGTARSLGVSDPYDARQNIMGGAKYLKQNLDRFGDVSLALAAYNAGPGSVQKYGGIPPYKETQNYVRKIMADYRGTDSLYSGKTVSVVSGGRQGSFSQSKTYYDDGSDWMSVSRLLGSSPNLPLLYALSQKEEGDLKGEDWANIVQIVRLQMMMNSGEKSEFLI